MNKITSHTLVFASALAFAATVHGQVIDTGAAAKAASDETKQINKQLSEIRNKASDSPEVKAAREKATAAQRAVWAAQGEANKTIDQDAGVKAAQEKLAAAQKELNAARKTAESSDAHKAAVAKLDAARKEETAARKAVDELIGTKVNADPVAKGLTDRLGELNKALQPAPKKEEPKKDAPKPPEAKKEEPKKEAAKAPEVKTPEAKPAEPKTNFGPKKDN